MNSLKNEPFENILTSLKIYEYYPNKIAKYAVEKNGKWSAGVFAVKEYGLTEVIFCFDRYKFNSEEEALSSLSFIIEEQINLIRIMSN